MGSLIQLDIQNGTRGGTLVVEPGVVPAGTSDCKVREEGDLQRIVAAWHQSRHMY